MEVDPGDRLSYDWLRVYFLHICNALSDPMAEEMLYDSEAIRRFAGVGHWDMLMAGNAVFQPIAKLR